MGRLATDVGGTFTDLVEFDEATGALTVAKALTTPRDPAQGVLHAAELAAIDPSGGDFFVHGGTTVINAITERKGVKTALVTTEGFRDSLEIARGNRPDYFNLHYVKGTPFVPRHLRREVPGRIAPDGDERRPLDLSGLPAILDDFR